MGEEEDGEGPREGKKAEEEGDGEEGLDELEESEVRWLVT